MEDHAPFLAPLLAFSIPQTLALITGIVYVALAAFEKPACWVFGIVSCAFVAWEDFTNFRLYADGVLQLFYVAMGFVGLYQWKFARQDERKMPIVTWPSQRHAILVAAALILSVPLWLLLREFTNAVYGYLDSATTLLSLAATWMLVRKVLSNWIYWIGIDAVYIFLFLSRGGHLVAVLYLVFLVVAVIGYFAWANSFRRQGAVEIKSK